MRFDRVFGPLPNLSTIPVSNRAHHDLPEQRANLHVAFVPALVLCACPRSLYSLSVQSELPTTKALHLTPRVPVPVPMPVPVPVPKTENPPIKYLQYRTVHGPLEKSSCQQRSSWDGYGVWSMDEYCMDRGNGYLTKVILSANKPWSTNPRILYTRPRFDQTIHICKTVQVSG